MEKDTRKSNNTGVIAILAILLIAVLAFGIWAWSKYTTTLTGDSATTVAKWKFGTETTLTDLNLATTGGAVVFDEVNNVKTDRIAPGTSGHFTVALDTAGTEVALEYVIQLTGMTDSKPTNLHFYSDKDCTKLIDTADGAKYSGYISQDDTGTVHNVTIYWKWAYETEPVATNDPIDTADGEAAAANGVTFDMTITGTQVNPADAQVTTTADN
ncbi:MAG: hypothetical protein J6A89_07985 [Clostridia bacterium]|nr:hypothetical protein [Clostridia bacterium]